MKVPWWSFLDKTSNTSRGEDIRHLTVVAVWHDPLESCELTSHLNDKSLEKAKQWWMRSSHRHSYTLRIKKPCHQLLTMGDLTLWRSTCYSQVYEAAHHPSPVLWWLKHRGSKSKHAFLSSTSTTTLPSSSSTPRARVKLIFWFWTVMYIFLIMCSPINNAQVILVFMALAYCNHLAGKRRSLIRQHFGVRPMFSDDTMAKTHVSKFNKKYVRFFIIRWCIISY